MAGLRLYRHSMSDKERSLFQGCVATVGNFDGMHRGHRQIVRRAGGEAARLGLPLVVILFEPQPLEFLRPAAAPPRLMRLSEKLACLADWEVDAVLCLRFNTGMAALTAEEFIRRILVDALHVQWLIIGDDFRFGCQRTGDLSLLQDAGEKFGFGVRCQPTVFFDADRLSSTRVREALVANDLSLAQRLLGRPFSKGGCVIRGARRGRRLGFPTINMAWRGEALLSGSYVSRLRCDGRMWEGVSYVGKRPFYGDTERALMETHLLDYDGDLYSRWVWLDFLSHLRSDQRFSNTDELVERIGHDVQQARIYHREQNGCTAEQNG